jgi:hypothetical protein
MPKLMKYIGLNDFDEDDPLNEYFSENSFESKLFINNSGSTLIFMIIYVFAWFILLILKIIVFFMNKLENIYTKLKILLIWNGSITLMNAQFSNLLMCSMINIQYM